MTETPDQDTESLIGGSPLREADPSSIDELLTRINDGIIAGTISNVANDEALLRQLIEVYRKQAEIWAVEESKPKAKSPRQSNSHRLVVDIEL